MLIDKAMLFNLNGISIMRLEIEISYADEFAIIFKLCTTESISAGGGFTFLAFNLSRKFVDVKWAKNPSVP